LVGFSAASASDPVVVAQIFVRTASQKILENPVVIAFGKVP